MSAEENDQSGRDWWQRQYRVGDVMLRASALLFAAGLGIIFAEGPVLSGVEFSESVLQAGEYLFLVAIVTVIVALILMVVMLLGHQAAHRDLLPAELSLPRPW